MNVLLPILLLSILFPSCAQDEKTEVLYGTSASGTEVLYGTSASGNAIKGMVTIRSANGNTAECPIDSNGYFAIELPSLTPPFLLSAKGSVNDRDIHYYSYASAYGRVNISQLTHATVSMAIKNDASQYYADFPDADLPDTNDIQYYASGISLLLSDSYTELGLKEDFDFMHDDFSTNGKGFDLLLDRISLSISSYVFLSDKDTQLPIFVHDINDDENLIFLTPENVSELLVLNHCSSFFQNLAIWDLMSKVYYWNNYLPDVNASDYSDPLRFLNVLRYQKDKWSSIVPKDIFDLYMKDSAYVGLGFYMARDFNSDLRICFVYPDSPAAQQNLTRGDIILEINNIPSNEIVSQIDSTFDGDTPGEKVLLKIQKINGDIVTLNLIKQELKISSDLYSTILDINDKSIGYLVFNKFVLGAIDDLAPVFKHFKDNDISELILDLRYNSGGLMDIALHLASLIGGSQVVDKTFCKIKFNENYADMNSTNAFVALKNSLDIDRLVVITTETTCSASELVINGLKPYMDVVVIGSPTCGKPVGMNPFSVCDNYLLPVTNVVFNALDEGEYYEGIDVDCYAVDDLSKPFGDVNEDSLSEAIYYIENGHCSYQKRHRVETQPFPLRGFRQEIGAF